MPLSRTCLRQDWRNPSYNMGKAKVKEYLTNKRWPGKKVDNKSTKCWPVSENEGRGKVLGDLGVLLFKKYTLKLDALYSE
jgi:hypothetical protein